MPQRPDIPEIARIAIDRDAIEHFNDEQEFVRLAVDILVEVGSHLSIAACILPADRRSWTRNEAVLGGYLVRLCKLTSALLDQTCQYRRETSFIFARLAFEAIVNILFLIENNTPSTIDSFISHSMRHERRLRDQIRRNIEMRGGEVWPIEQRMLASIERSAKDSGIDLDTIDVPKNWGGKNLYEKAEAVGLGAAYLGAFSGPSHSVHGNWQDILEYHIEEQAPGEFVPDPRWHQPRPQLLTTVARLAVMAMQKYLNDIVGPAADGLREPLVDLQERIQLFTELHENFLAQRMKEA